MDSITGKNSGLNLGPGTPVIHFEQWEEDEIEVLLISKAAGARTRTYSIPFRWSFLRLAGQTGIWTASTGALCMRCTRPRVKGAAPDFSRVRIGGDRTSGYDCAKLQLFRELDDATPIPSCWSWRTVCCVTQQAWNRHDGFRRQSNPARLQDRSAKSTACEFLVSVAYNCWAFRRLGVRLNSATGEITRWIYRAESPEKMSEDGVSATGLEIVLHTPLTEESVRNLKVGDTVLLNGPMYTGRDALHKYLVSHNSPVNLEGATLYHCGPVMLKDEDGSWHVRAAGPTTSIREEPYQADILKKFGIRAVIGKGGMGKKTLDALQEVGAVYLNAIGGAAQFYADKITSVDGVDFLEEFGIRKPCGTSKLAILLP